MEWGILNGSKCGSGEGLHIGKRSKKHCWLYVIEKKRMKEGIERLEELTINRLKILSDDG